MSKFAVAVSALVLGGAVATTPGAYGKSHAIRVIETQGESAGEVLATFRSAKCRKASHGFRARARSRNDWSLKVRIRPFDGYHRYKLPYGLPARARFYVDPPGGDPSFSNTWTPEGVPLPPVGGALDFPGRSGKALSLGFPSTFDSRELPATRRVAVRGRVSCR